MNKRASTVIAASLCGVAIFVAVSGCGAPDTPITSNSIQNGSHNGKLGESNSVPIAVQKVFGVNIPNNAETVEGFIANMAKDTEQTVNPTVEKFGKTDVVEFNFSNEVTIVFGVHGNRVYAGDQISKDLLSGNVANAFSDFMSLNDGVLNAQQNGTSIVSSNFLPIASILAASAASRSITSVSPDTTTEDTTTATTSTDDAVSVDSAK